MIRRWIKTLTQKLRPRPKPVQLPAARFGIAPEQISPGARHVCETLQRHGHQAFVVGGAVRDLLLGRQPKDFDVATDARPEQVRQYFRRAYLVGRRFRIVHVVHGRETVEVTTFRARLDPEAAPTDEHGRILSDNVFGTQEEDAERRDFTANALYYDPVADLIHDFHHGVGDLQARTLRVIGDPETRYREDPVRMLRAVRLATKLDLVLDADAAEPLRRLAPLLVNVPDARLVDELIKVLTSGRAWDCLQRLHAEGLDVALPLVESLFAHPEDTAFVRLVLEATDARIVQGKPVSNAFTLAAVLWPQVRRHWHARQAQGVPVFPALEQAIAAVLDSPACAGALTRSLAAEMRELWYLQPRFDKRVGRAPYRLIEQPRYRAGWDFLVLRSRGGEVDPALPVWWDRFAHASEEERARLIQEAQRSGAPPAATKKRRRKKRARSPAESANREPSASTGTTP